MSRVSNKPNPFRRLLGDSSGASALEFSFVLFPFILLLIGTMELGRYYFTAQNLRTVVAEAGRLATIYPQVGISGSGCSGGSGKDLRGEYAVDTTMTKDDLEYAASRTPFLNLNDLTVCVTNGAGPGTVTITVRAVYPFSSPFPILSYLNGNMGQQSQLTLRRL